MDEQQLDRMIIENLDENGKTISDLKSLKADIMALIASYTEEAKQRETDLTVMNLMKYGLFTKDDLAKVMPKMIEVATKSRENLKESKQNLSEVDDV